MRRGALGWPPLSICVTRSLTDDLVDLLIETIHRIGARAERKVERELLNDIKHVTGKHNLLFELADATLAQPDGVVREVIFPVVGEETLRDLVKEWKATGPTYRTTLRTVIRNSYQGHYRRMVPKLLAALEFRSNNERHRPVMQALELVKRFADTKLRTFPAEEEVPLDGVVRGLWRDAVVEKDAAGRDRINRVTYEVAVLEALREQLRCKEIWVVGANRYRNPDEDLPADFEANRDEYYKALDLPLDADRFISQVQDEMREALDTLNRGLKKNPDVCIGPKGGGWITLTPLDKQPDPPNLKAFKAELNATWPMTSLLDMVKETDLRLGFTDVLKSPTAYAVIEMAPGDTTVGSTPTRNKVYPRWISEGKIAEATANHRRDCISEAIRLLDEVCLLTRRAADTQLTFADPGDCPSHPRRHGPAVR